MLAVAFAADAVYRVGHDAVIRIIGFDGRCCGRTIPVGRAFYRGEFSAVPAHIPLIGKSAAVAALRLDAQVVEILGPGRVSFAGGLLVDFRRCRRSTGYRHVNFFCLDVLKRLPVFAADWPSIPAAKQQKAAILKFGVRIRRRRKFRVFRKALLSLYRAGKHGAIRICSAVDPGVFPYAVPVVVGRGYGFQRRGCVVCPIGISIRGNVLPAFGLQRLSFLRIGLRNDDDFGGRAFGCFGFFAERVGDDHLVIGRAGLGNIRTVFFVCSVLKFLIDAVRGLAAVPLIGKLPAVPGGRRDGKRLHDRSVAHPLVIDHGIGAQVRFDNGRVRGLRVFRRRTGNGTAQIRFGFRRQRLNGGRTEQQGGGQHQCQSFSSDCFYFFHLLFLPFRKDTEKFPG